ncbi:MAG: tRNA (adenosine(37)-N6)-threonylcarbamoyltransferase complex dimerization subunit type 1 TsaB [Proteobacteria bacterium]|nr:tRNA (adenosine(37)-N6)-threonylcarbamoyltransferase complex dimerization subunit type 1 TsaB [Pseudomonadota bacterium]
MKILAMDTALNACSVALTEDGDVQAHLNEKRARGHAETLLPMINSLMMSVKWRFSDLDLIAVTVGPGTFTGLRIGLAAARGIALAAEKPIIGVTTLEALAVSVPIELTNSRPIIATADARRGEIYFQAFLKSNNAEILAALSPPKAAPVAECQTQFPEAPAVFIGSGAELLPDKDQLRADGYTFLDHDPDPDAVMVAKLAALRELPDRKNPPPDPLYLRAPDAKLPGGKPPPP